MDLNHDNEMGARTESIRDQALPATGHVGITLAPFDGRPDGPSGEIATPLPSRLIVPAGMAQRSPCQGDLTAGLIGCTPDDGAEPPMLIMNPTLSINSHGTRLRAA
jgi:hypothetical protein